VKDPISRRQLLSTSAGAALAAVSGTSLRAEEKWPTKPITIVVGVPPGSTNDAIARLIAKAISPALGQPVLVENKSGAGGSIGTAAVARAKPDGYTLMLGTSSQLVMNVPVYTNLGFSIENDIVSVALLSRSRLVLLAKKGFAASNVKELIAIAKQRGDTLNYGTSGPGGIIHISTEKFLADADIKIPPIHYRGSGPAFQALLAGEVDILIDGTINAGQHVNTGAVKALAISDRRSPLIPDVATFKEQGLNNSDSYTWNSIMAPKDTPRAIIDRLNSVINDALKTPLLTDYIKQSDAMSLIGSTPESTDAYWRNELRIWTPLIKKLNIIPT
jgi:tripartite-type tricarboxylate transporter receptor subunit TctC